MASEPVTISNTPPVNPGLNYADLLADGVALTQEFSGEIWTNYNESDPGVTTLEQLCYALTDLSYRAELPMADLLVERSGRINARRQALYPARRIFPCNPLTIADYRKLLLDRIPSLGNVWLEPHRGHGPRAINGLYDILLYVPSLTPPPCTPQEDERELRTAVQRVYVRHRNLCEDLRSIGIAYPIRTIVFADANIGDAPSPEAILAQMFFRAELLLAPEPRRRSLQSLMNDGVEPSAIFNGPLMQHGFIDDDQLPPKAVTVRVQDLIRTMARSVGVISLRGVKVRAGDTTYGGNDSIPIPPHGVLRLDTKPDPRGRFTIRLFRNGLEITPDPARVQRELDRLWADQRRTYPLSAQYDDYFGFPSGTWRDLERYYSIQNQFPNVYGINAYGVPSDATPMRKAQAKQFKGYLMVFDQLLADYFAQLANAKDLYSTDAALSATYFFQYLDRSVPNAQPLLLPDYHEGLKRIIAKEDDTIERRNRFLDFLLALYGESLDASSVWTLNLQGEDVRTIDARLLDAKLELLRRIVAISHNRGRAFDYLERPSRGNHSGMEMKIRIQLGMDALDTHPLAEVADELGVHIASDEREPVNGRGLPRHTEVIEEQFVNAPPSDAFVSLNGMSIGESLLRGADVEQIRVGKLPGDTAYSVVWKSGAEWRLASKHADRDNAMNAGSSLASSLRTLRRRCQQLYIVEHTLLRYGRFRDDRREPPFSYSFTATAVLSPPASLRRDDDYRTFAREVIRANTPACVLIDDLFLTHAQMICFEALYWAWRRALRQQNRREMARTSADLRDFLQRHERDE